MFNRNLHSEVHILCKLTIFSYHRDDEEDEFEDRDVMDDEDYDEDDGSDVDREILNLLTSVDSSYFPICRKSISVVRGVLMLQNELFA